jgi:hypothetical protein
MRDPDGQTFLNFTAQKEFKFFCIKKIAIYLSKDSLKDAQAKREIVSPQREHLYLKNGSTTLAFDYNLFSLENLKMESNTAYQSV